MCGIAGFYNFNRENADHFIAAAINSLKHRGPDATSHFHEPAKGVGLLHARLSIIDLSADANQPFHSNDGRYVVINNGEIYNYQELKKELQNSYSFKTGSDTEVLLALYIKEKENCLQKLNGMFAFAIYDRQEDTLFIARDRMGKKPLFYSWQNNSFLFGSEIKAILHLDRSLSDGVDQNAMQWFLHLGYIPEPDTIYDRIKKFPAGHYALLKKDEQPVLKAYWRLPNPTANSARNYAQTKEGLKDLIIDSTRLRLQADVPFGAFLSGGTDSSLVSAVATTILNQPLKTFSIGFAEAAFNEAVHAKKVAQRLGTDHTEFIVTEKELQELLPKMIDVFDEPFADSSAIPTMMVSKLASEKVKMVITGDGGDELFLGYGMYNWARRLTNPIIWNSRSLMANLLSKGDQRMKRAAEVLKVPSKKAMYPHIFSQEQYFFSATEVNHLLVNSSFKYDRFQLPFKNANGIQQQAWLDLLFYLKDDLLVKVDRSTMRYGLEGRSPLLDYRLVEFSQTIPQEYKWKGNIQKYILKDILYDYLPQNLMDRPKWGFSIPLAKWLRKDWDMYKEQYLLPLTNSSLLNSGSVRHYITEFENGKDYYYNRIWILIVLKQFLDRVSL